MPFLRVIRDKRGYETTYLMHWHRDGNQQRSRILYLFRSPGGVRVGRESLEPDVLKQIEAQHPGIVFDWKAVFANRQVVDAPHETRRPRKRRRAEEEVAPPSPSTEPPAAAAAPAPRSPIPSSVQGSTPDEQIAFLAHWYPIIRERIPQRTADPARREALMALAERLNPSAWSDADQIAEGLPRATEALERLSHVFARRRRKRAARPGHAAPVVPPSAGDA